MSSPYRTACDPHVCAFNVFRGLDVARWHEQLPRCECGRVEPASPWFVAGGYRCTAIGFVLDSVFSGGPREWRIDPTEAAWRSRNGGGA